MKMLGGGEMDECPSSPSPLKINETLQYSPQHNAVTCSASPSITCIKYQFLIWYRSIKKLAYICIICTDGVECPIGLLWTPSNGSYLSVIPRERIYTLEDLDESSCAVRLNLSKELFVREGCPLTFQWRGKKATSTKFAYRALVQFGCHQHRHFVCSQGCP